MFIEWKKSSGWDPSSRRSFVAGSGTLIFKWRRQMFELILDFIIPYSSHFLFSFFFFLPFFLKLNPTPCPQNISFKQSLVSLTAELYCIFFGNAFSYHQEKNQTLQNGENCVPGLTEVWPGVGQGSRRSWTSCKAGTCG